MWSEDYLKDLDVLMLKRKLSFVVEQHSEKQAGLSAAGSTLAAGHATMQVPITINFGLARIVMLSAVCHFVFAHVYAEGR